MQAFRRRKKDKQSKDQNREAKVFTWKLKPMQE
jgi:hypothetical protein